MSKEQHKPVEEMSPEELEQYEEELLHEKKLRELKKLDAELQQQKLQEQQEQEKATKEKLHEEWKQEFYKENPEYAPKIKLTQPGEQKGGASQIQQFYNGYYQRNTKVESLSTYESDFSKDRVKSLRFQCWKNQRWDEVGIEQLFVNTDSDSGCEDDVSDWSPDDVYARVVWETFVCKADLFKIAVKGLAINPGQGLGVQIRAYGAFGDPTSLGSCECASCASISFSTYSLTLKQYNLEAIVCEKDIWDVGNILMDSYIKAMSDSWARWFDAQIYSELETATPGTEETLPAALSCTPAISGSCCSDASLVNLYNAVHNVVANMREGTGLAGPYNPDYLILSPTVAAIFKRMQSPTPMPWMGDIVFDGDGRLKKMAGLKVIEYCGANTCTDLTGQEVAIIIDSRRAVGAVFGQQPRMYKFFQTNCNSYRIDWWSFFAVGELDTDAIGHVVNP
jgi:hypothetical protein